MIIVFDKLIAVLVAGAVILILSGAHQRVQQSSLERTMMYAAKKQTLSFADLLERDLINAGYGTQPGESRPAGEWGVGALDTYADGTLKRLVFWGMGEGGARRSIRYQVTEEGAAIINGENKTLYRMTREEGQGGSWDEAGASPATLTSLTVELLDANGQPATAELTHKIRVRFSNAVLPAIQQERLLRGFRELNWGITLAPPNLRGYQGG